MQLQRRTFLSAIGVALATAAVPTLAAQITESTVVTAVPITDAVQPTKYETALNMMDGVIAARNYSSVMHPRVDALLVHLHTNWDIPGFDLETRRAAYHVIQGVNALDIDTLIRETPCTIIDAVWPVAVMRNLLRTQQLPIDHRELTEFRTFHERYGKFILDELPAKLVL